MTHKTTWLAFVLLLLVSVACAPATPPLAPAATEPPATPVRPTPTPLPPAPWEAPWYVEGVTVETYAGTGEPGYKDGPATEAQFNRPYGIAADAVGNVYVFDYRNLRIRRIAPDGMVTTVAGTGEPGFADGPGDTAQFLGRGFLALDTAGNLYLGDGGNHRVRRITPDGTVSTLAGTGEAGYRDGPADQAQFNYPQGVAADAAGNVYVADRDNNRIRLVTPRGEVRTLAGTGEPGYRDGPGAEAQFDTPNSLTVDVAGNVIVGEGTLLRQRGTNRLRLITPDGMVTTLAGSGKPGHKDGLAAEARFTFPHCPTLDAAGNLFVVNSNDFRVRLITSDSLVYTLAGTGESASVDGPGPVAQFVYALCAAAGPKGELYVPDLQANTIRRIAYGNPADVSPLPTATPPLGERVIKIGVSLHGSWRTTLVARLAVDEANSASVVSVNDEPYTLKVVTSNACCGDEGPIFGAEWLLEQGVVAVVAPVLQAGYLPQSPVYGAAGVVHITPGGQNPSFTLEGPATAYRLGPNLAYGAPTTARIVYEELGIRRAALLPETTGFPQAAADSFQKAFEALGGEVFRHDVTAENLPESLETVREERAEAVVVFLPTIGFADSLALQIHETGLPIPLIGYVIGARISPALAEGMYDVAPGLSPDALPGYDDFVAKWHAANLPPDPGPNEWTALAYDATNVIIAAIRRAAETGAVTRESVAAAMETFRDEPYQGIIGPIQFDEYGDLLDQPFSFKKMVRGEWVDVER